jgi:precorrin-6B methylase 2
MVVYWASLATDGWPEDWDMRYAGMVLMGLGWGLAACGQDAPKPAATEHAKTHDMSKLNSRFLNPKLDVKASAAQLEGKGREVAAKRAEIVSVLSLKPGQAVADIGAGTGLFAREFARAVGPQGRVDAVEISPAFLKHLAEVAEQPEFLGILKPIEGGTHTTNLKPNSIDVAFICDTYHHFEDPVGILESIRLALRPGGRLFLVEFDKRPESSEFIKSHARATQAEFVAEIEAAGFQRLKDLPKVDLKENFLAGFRKTSDPASTGAVR